MYEWLARWRSIAFGGSQWAEILEEGLTDARRLVLFQFLYWHIIIA
jgi:hypothetical protein